MPESNSAPKPTNFTEGKQVSSTSLTKIIEDTFNITLKPCRWKRCAEIRSKFIEGSKPQTPNPKALTKITVRHDSLELNQLQLVEKMANSAVIDEIPKKSRRDKPNNSNCSIQIINITGKTHCPRFDTESEKLKPAIVNKSNTYTNPSNRKKVSFCDDFQVAEIENWKGYNFDVAKTGYFCDKKGSCGCSIF